MDTPRPITRLEQYLSAMAGGSADVPDKPITRVEQYLAAILENGGSGGGTTNYNALSNKPSINGVTLSGDISLSAIMADVTQEDVEEALPPEEIERIVEAAWNTEEGGD